MSDIGDGRVVLREGAIQSVDDDAVEDVVGQFVGEDVVEDELGVEAVRVPVDGKQVVIA